MLNSRSDFKSTTCSVLLVFISVFLGSCAGTTNLNPSATNKTKQLNQNEIDIDLIAPEFSETAATIDDEGGWNFTTKVTDNIGVKSVTLFYRFQSGQKFFSRQLRSVENGNLFRFQFKFTPTQPIEYFLNASDLAGNSIFRGSEESPLETTENLSATSKANDQVRQYERLDQCKQSSIFGRIPSEIYATKRTVRRNGKNIPESIARNINLNDGRFYLYSKWQRSPVGEFKIKGYLYDGEDRLVHEANWEIESSGLGYTTWLNYTPKITDAEGEWIYVVCIDRERQAMVKFRGFRK